MRREKDYGELTRYAHIFLDVEYTKGVIKRIKDSLTNSGPTNFVMLGKQAAEYRNIKLRGD